MQKSYAGVIFAGFLACCCLVLYCTDTETKPKGGLDGSVQLPTMPTPTEAQMAPKLARASNGRLVHVSGMAATTEEVEDTTLGRAVVLTSIDDRALCNVVFEAKEKAKKPDALAAAWGKASEPVKMSAPDAKGIIVWNALAKGQDCLEVAKLPGYLCSTLDECLSLPIEKQARFLKVKGTCHIPAHGHIPAQDVNCAVPVGDPKAIAGEKPFFPHSWADLNELNMTAKSVDAGNP